MVDIHLGQPPPAALSYNRTTGHAKVEHEWFTEPRKAIDALLDAETFAGPIWDPACGAGNIPQACAARGHAVLGTDIVDRGYGRAPIDFLGTLPHDVPGTALGAMIFNPPFRLAVPFVLRALTLVPKVAILARSSFLEGRGRHAALFRPYPPAKVFQFTWRVSCPPGGTDIPAKGGSVPYCWIVWDGTHQGPTQLRWLV